MRTTLIWPPIAKPCKETLLRKNSVKNTPACSYQQCSDSTMRFIKINSSKKSQSPLLWADHSHNIKDPIVMNQGISWSKARQQLNLGTSWTWGEANWRYRRCFNTVHGYHWSFDALQCIRSVLYTTTFLLGTLCAKQSQSVQAIFLFGTITF